MRMDRALVLPSRPQVPAQPACLHARTWLGARTDGLYFTVPPVCRMCHREAQQEMEVGCVCLGEPVRTEGGVCQLCRPSPQPPAEKPAPPSSTARVPGGQDLSATGLGSPEKAVEKRALPCTHPKGRAGWW